MDPFLMNRLANASNIHQGSYKKVLCICSAGLLRSPTAAFVLSQEPYNYNTRAAGLTPEFALIPVDIVLIEWADEIVCMSSKQQIQLINTFPQVKEMRVINLDIPDQFAYRDPNLIDTIKLNYDKINKELEK